MRNDTEKWLVACGVSARLTRGGRLIAAIALCFLATLWGCNGTSLGSKGSKIQPVVFIIPFPDCPIPFGTKLTLKSTATIGTSDGTIYYRDSGANIAGATIPIHDHQATAGTDVSLSPGNHTLTAYFNPPPMSRYDPAESLPVTCEVDQAAPPQ
jgi:hypothetical protein